MSDGAGAVLFNTDAVEVQVKDGVATIANQAGFIGVGFDGSNYRFFRTDSSGYQIIVGSGTAGTPAGGVVSVQGVSGGQALPVSAASLPLPTGAATEATLATRASEATLSSIEGNIDVALSTRASEATLATLLTEATFTARVPVLVTGGGTEAAALRVTIANDSTGVLSVDDNGGSITVDTPQLPASLIGGRLDTNVGAWFGATTPTVGQKTSTASLPVVIASDQSAVSVVQSGTWTVQQGTPPWDVQLEEQLDFDTGAGTQPVSLVGIALPASGGAVAGGTATDPVRTDPTGTTTQPVSDAGGTLTVDDGGTSLSVDDGGNVLSVDDAGGSLTVDTPQLPAALVGGRLDVVVGAALPAGTNNIGDVDVLTVPAPLSTTGGGTEAAALRVTIANDSTGLVSVDDNSGSLTVDTPQLPAALVGGRLTTNVGAWLGATTPTVGQKAMTASIPVAIASDQSAIPATQSGTWTVQQGTPPWSVVGPGASGAALSGNPVRVAGSDGTLTRNLLTDTSGRPNVVGAAADGAAVTGNPVLVAGQDGTNAQSLKTDTTGRAEVIGGAATGVAVAGNPVRVGGSDGTLTRDIITDTTGRQRVVGTAATGVAVAGDPVRIAGSDGTLTRDMLTDTSGRQVVVGPGTAAVPNGGVLTTQKPRSATATLSNVTGSTSSVTVLAANTARLGASVYNDSNKKMYLKCGTTASTTSFTVVLVPNAYYEMPFEYTGVLTAVWASGVSGSARVTEFTT